MFQVGTCSSHIRLELLPGVVWTSQSTPAQCMFVHSARLSPCAKTQSVTFTHFFVTISVATAGDFSLDLFFFDSGQILEMCVVLLYFLFKNTVVS